MTKTDWDYSAMAAFYDNRADYSSDAIDYIIHAMGLECGSHVADVGAGTGKLAVPLGSHGLIVSAVEPNDEMRIYGIRNTSSLPVTWRDGTGEHTGLEAASVEAVFFGSSFNVVDQISALQECRRIVRPRGWFSCMWNHRNLDDPLQSRIEAIIRSFIPSYHYGLRREDPSGVLAQSGYFSEILVHSADFAASMTKTVIMDAWRSHGTLIRQAGDAHGAIIAAIEDAIDSDEVAVPYTTRLWYGQFSS